MAPPLMERALHILDLKFNIIDSRGFYKIGYEQNYIVVSWLYLIMST